MKKARTQRYIESLNVWSQSPRNSFDDMLVAICLTKLEDYSGALAQYRTTLSEFLLPGRSNWRDSALGKVWNLVDTYTLGQGQVPLSEMVYVVESHKWDERGNVSPALYSYAVMSMLAGRDTEALSYVPGILALSKVKQYYPAAKIIEAIVAKDPGRFNEGLSELIAVHTAMARHGAWRRYPEGYLCLPAMSLSLIARRRGMAVTVQSEYLSFGYLDYLDALPEAHDWPIIGP